MKLKIEAIPLKLKGALEIKPGLFEDSRGFLFESYNAQELKTVGIDDIFVQENHIGSKKGVIRGLHFQRSPYATSKLVRCIYGEVFDVIVDLRKNSPTFGQWEGIILSPQNRKMIYVPEGFAHSVCGLSDWSEVVYKMNRFFRPEYDAGVRWNDPDIGISWPAQNPIISEKDSKLPFLAEIKASLV